MIDAYKTTENRANGHAAGKNARRFYEEFRSSDDARPADNDGKNFNSFQHIAEQGLREQNQNTALTLTDETVVMFRALPLAREEIEKIRSEVQILQQRHGNLSLGFAGAQSGEGASTILANLVIDLKRTNLRVLVVDLNVQHPNLPGMFSLPDGPGLIDLINGEQKFAEVIRVIKSNRIFLLPLGKAEKDTHIELETAVRAINKAGKNSKYFDLILFDFPPLNEVPQALYAARQVDGLIQVVQAERTRIEVVRTLKGKLEHLGIQLFGAVLNQRRFYVPKAIYENL